VTAWVLMVLGLAALITGAELLVRGGSRLAARLGIAPIVVGVTVVSLGTSTPELAIGVQSALQDDGTLALGNIAGTNTVNLLLILGLSALIRPLAMKTETLRFDLPVMSAAALLLLVMAWDGVLSRTEGVIMILGAALYAGWIVVWTCRESQAVKDEYEHELGVPSPQRTRRAVAVNVTLLVAGIVVIVVGADLLVDGAVQIAQTFGVSDAVIGLTIVAVGTSAPELVTTMVSTVKDDRDIAIGNILGSSVYNILLILGVTAVVAPRGAIVEPDLARIDIPVMVAATIVCIPVFITGRRVSRLEGGAFVASYLVYLMSLVLTRV
jgi:cation:H+ antiporter